MRKFVLFVVLFLLTSAAAAFAGAHDTLTWTGNGMCVQCHESQARDMYQTGHYQWKGETPYIVNGPAKQGKIYDSVNSYCINIMGNWGGCGACHVGTGAQPVETATPTIDQLKQIDCLVCHQDKYVRARNATTGLFEPNTSAMTITMDQAVRTVAKPTRKACLQCHAKGGGGDNYKRGDLALAHGSTSDSNFDYHMATTGRNFTCTTCHKTQNHKIAGRGSDLRITELDVDMSCAQSGCHLDVLQSGDGHDFNKSKHFGRVACQSCHIPTYAKNASDTTATEATEIHRTWTEGHATASGAIHPVFTFANNLIPEYKFWNGYSDNYLLFDNAVIDPVTGNYPTSRPMGDINEGKIYPFKYKTAEQPLADNDNVLIALDTKVFFATGNADAAIQSGLANMGLASQPYTWIYTDTYQLITHETARENSALSCNDCHEGGRIDFEALGYVLKNTQAMVCSQCHGQEDYPGFFSMHNKHSIGKGFDCSNCHNFTRPERLLNTNPSERYEEGHYEHD